MLYITPECALRQGDQFEISVGDRKFTGIVLNSGEGESSADDDPYYWLHAYSKGMDLSQETQTPDVETRFLLVLVKSSALPVDDVPQVVSVRCHSVDQTHQFVATSVVGGKLNEGHYALYLEYLPNH